MLRALSISRVRGRTQIMTPKCSTPPGRVAWASRLRQPHAFPARGMGPDGLTQLCHPENLARMLQSQAYDQHTPGGVEEGLSQLTKTRNF